MNIEEEKGGCKCSMSKVKKREAMMSSDLQENGKKETGYIALTLTGSQVVV